MNALGAEGEGSPTQLRVLVLHGPNLNLLGHREPHIYGDLSLPEIDRKIVERGRELGIEVRSVQSNVEGELIDALQDGARWADAIIINAGGYSHTSVSIRDAIAAGGVPTIAAHLTNPAAREEFRHVDVVAGACSAVIAGFGWHSYTIALESVLLVKPATARHRR